MGQRLVINVNSGGECIANSYHHWSAYTSSALAITQQFINTWDSVLFRLVQQGIANIPLTAIRTLEEIGASMTDNAKNLFLKKYPDLLEIGKEPNRNEGLIEIDENGFEQNRAWEEGRVDINVDTRTVDFAVWYEADEETLAYYVDEDDAMSDEERQAAIKKLKEELENISIGVDLSCIPFDRFAEAANVINEADYVFKWGSNLIDKIE